MFSCSTGKNTISNSKAKAEAADARDGSSYEKAVIINASNGSDGIRAEYAWLRENYPGYKLISQALSRNEGKPYDIINIETADGDELSIYFDISNFFGKF